MAFICFVGTYKPIMCGIADYTGFITKESPPGRWGVLSFDPVEFGSPLVRSNGVSTEPVRYVLHTGNELSAPIIEDGLRQINAPRHETVVWFQHDFGIWPDDNRFVKTLQEISVPRIITFHTLHFQSNETPSGLREREYHFLEQVLPHVEAVTVFTRGVYKAVVSAFPEIRQKVHVLEHGISSCPTLWSFSRSRAKSELHDFLINKSNLDGATKRALERERVLLDPNVLIIGQTGFLCPLKQSELLYEVRDKLQQHISGKRVIAVRIGSPREEPQAAYAKKLQLGQNGRDKFLLNLWLPPKILPLAQRAFDVNFYWPSECTQSGVVAHALGAGALIAGRDLEGVGEVLSEAGQVVERDLPHLLMRMKQTISSPESIREMESLALAYARSYSWKKQADEHFALAQRVIAEKEISRSIFLTIPHAIANGITKGKNGDIGRRALC